MRRRRARLGILIKFRRFYLTVPRSPPAYLTLARLLVFVSNRRPQVNTLLSWCDSIVTQTTWLGEMLSLSVTQRTIHKTESCGQVQRSNQLYLATYAGVAIAATATTIYSIRNLQRAVGNHLHTLCRESCSNSTLAQESAEHQEPRLGPWEPRLLYHRGSVQAEWGMPARVASNFTACRTGLLDFMLDRLKHCRTLIAQPALSLAALLIVLDVQGVLVVECDISSQASSQTFV
jgi:hypothetical protein